MTRPLTALATAGAVLFVAGCVAQETCGMSQHDIVLSVSDDRVVVEAHIDRRVARGLDQAEIVQVEGNPWCDGGCLEEHGETLASQRVTAPEQALTLRAETPAVPYHHYAGRLLLQCGGGVVDVHDESSDTRVPAPSGDLDDPSLLVGRVFGARGEFWALEVLEPTGSNGELLGYAISMPWLPLLHVESLDAETGEVALRMAWTDRGDEHEGPGQRPCSETLALPTAMLEDDVLRVGPMDLEVATSAGRANVYDFYLTGSPGADATTLRNLEFGGLFDLRDLEQDLASTADTFCRESSLECKPCPDEAPVCVTLHLRAEVAYDHGPEPRDLACASELAEPALYSYGSERIITRSLDDPNVLRGLDFEGVEVWHRDDWSTGSAAASVKMYLVPAERADRLDPPRTQEVLLVLETQDATRWVEHHLDPATGAALHEQLHTDGSAANAIAELLASALGWWLGLGCSTGPVPTGGAAPLFSVALILASRRRLWRSPRR